ncbi:MAG: hypothetical protein Q4G30_02100 [Actinomycetaceae bacterium]|nr:hypothetical protein [Actinomycetaceae bacterium]
MNPDATTDSEQGEVTVEFLVVTLLVLIPLIYLVLTISELQRAGFALEAGAREASRILTAKPDAKGYELAFSSAALALEDQGIDVPPELMSVTCLKAPCPGPSGEAEIHLKTQVTLPLLPDFLAQHLPVSIPVEATRSIQWGPYVAP